MKIFPLINIILCILFISCSKDPIVSSESYNCNASFVDNSSSHPKKASFDSAMKKLEQIVPGVQVSVRSIDGNIWTGTQGMVDIKNNNITENCSKYLIGSVSKIFTSVLILNLEEEGLLSIDEPISDWIAPNIIENIENTDQATIKNLLMHTSGIKEYISASTQFQFDRLNNSKLLLTPEQKLEYIYNKSADFAINEKYGYSNTNYVLLGLIIEKVKSMPLNEVVKLYISDIIGLENTIAGTAENPLPTGISRPYLDLGNGHYQDVMDFALSDAATGDGGIISNSQDMLLFIENMVNTTLVSSTSFQKMLDNRVEIEKDKWYGLGIELENRENGFRLAHSGGAVGYTAFLLNYPDSNVTVAVCINSSSNNVEVRGKISSFLKEIQQIAFE